jgi:hypothetical protein
VESISRIKKGAKNMKLLGKEIRIFGKKKQSPNIEVVPVIILEETVSVSTKINKQRVNPTLKFESQDFFASKKIFFPAGTPEEQVEKQRQEARDTCWKQLHELELDFVHSLGRDDWDTDWMRIQEAREREAAEEALRELELQQDEEAKAILGIVDEPTEDELKQIDGPPLPPLSEKERNEIIEETFPEPEDSLPPNASPTKRTGETPGIDTESGGGTGNPVVTDASTHDRGGSGKGKEPMDNESNESKAAAIIKKEFGDIL